MEFGHSPDATTNTKMELTVAIKALEYIEHPTDVILHIGLTYLKDAFSKFWIVATKPVKVIVVTTITFISIPHHNMEVGERTWQ